MKLRALTVGESIVLGGWIVTRNRRDAYTLTSYPFKMGTRTRFGTLAARREVWILARSVPTPTRELARAPTGLNRHAGGYRMEIR
jgi:hypothetical protein